jgi:hypothetical protein
MGSHRPACSLVDRDGGDRQSRLLRGQI